MSWAFKRLKRLGAGEPVETPVPASTEAELRHARGMRLLEELCLHWGVQLGYFPGDNAHENPEFSFSVTWLQERRGDMEQFEWGNDASCANRLAHAVQSFVRQGHTAEFVHLGDEWLIRPLDCLAPREAATDFPADYSWALEWSNMAAGGATVAGAPLLGFLRTEWADYARTKQVLR